ncbi:MAG: ATP-grasp domain-containing protein [Planctomycetes bacterium]|nr:ATP-grasp domain-containing protein [Planctomycetota bacterium]
MPDTRVLVVGTTTDYVHWIDRTWPGRALFVTDPAERSRGIEPAPDERTELLEDLRNSQRVRRALTAHLRRHDIRLGGITCYDCEALALAAKLAQALELPYPSLDTVELCRDKFECKSVWRAADVPCPDGAIIHTAAEAVAFQQRVGGVCVLKPPTGSGSEYVFLCNGPDEAAAGVTSIQQAMVRQAGNRMYAGARERIVAEQYAVGDEYSCDFLLEEQGLRIVRLAKKVRLRRGPFGTIHGYEVPAGLPSGLGRTRLTDVLQRAARAVGLSRSVCMADFIVTPEGPMMLELAPRPGGDCLPDLILRAGDVDMIGLALDVAEGRPIHLPPANRWKRHVAVRIHATQSGTIHHIDTRKAAADPRVCQVTLIRQKGHRVILPPEHYDLWVLGFIIFRPDPKRAVAVQCEELLAGVQVVMEDAA